VSKLVSIHGDGETAAAGTSAKGDAKRTKLPRWRNPAKAMTANEATLRAWKKSYENRHGKEKVTTR
jgi:hypothetical protein